MVKLITPGEKSIPRVLEMKDLVSILNQPVIILTNDGRCLAGIFHSFDSSFNIILKRSHERIYSIAEGVSVTQLGSQLVRGDNVGVIGKISTVLEGDIDFEAIRAEPPKSMPL